LPSELFDQLRFLLNDETGQRPLGGFYFPAYSRSSRSA
jgi:hypothetical protein